MAKPPPAKAGEVNYSFVDRFTFVHFMIGMGYGSLGFGLGITLLLALTWELVENPLKAHVPVIFPNATADTWQNAVGDCLAVLLGWAVHHYYFI